MGWTLWQHTQSSLHHRLPQVPLDETLDAVPTFEKVGSDSSAKQQQRARCRLNPCWGLQGGTALMEKLHQLFQLIWQQETLPQDCTDASTIMFTSARETTRPVASWNLPALHITQGPGQSSTQPPHCTSWERPPTREPVWFPETGCTLLDSSKRSVRTECWPALHLCQSDQGLWHCHQRWPLKNHHKVWVPPEIHYHCKTASWWHADIKTMVGASRQWWDIPAVPYLKGSEARMCPYNPPSPSSSPPSLELCFLDA